MLMQPNALPVGQAQPKPTEGHDLNKLIKFLLDRNRRYATERAYAEITIRWKEGRIDMVDEHRQIKPAKLLDGL
jgi:hypothetical protein